MEDITTQTTRQTPSPYKKQKIADPFSICYIVRAAPRLDLSASPSPEDDDPRRSTHTATAKLQQTLIGLTSSYFYHYKSNTTR